MSTEPEVPKKTKNSLRDIIDQLKVRGEVKLSDRTLYVQHIPAGMVFAKKYDGLTPESIGAKVLPTVTFLNPEGDETISAEDLAGMREDDQVALAEAVLKRSSDTSGRQGSLEAVGAYVLDAAKRYDDLMSSMPGAVAPAVWGGIDSNISEMERITKGMTKNFGRDFGSLTPLSKPMAFEHIRPDPETDPNYRAASASEKSAKSLQDVAERLTQIAGLVAKGTQQWMAQADGDRRQNEKTLKVANRTLYVTAGAALFSVALSAYQLHKSGKDETKSAISQATAEKESHARLVALEGMQAQLTQQVADQKAQNDLLRQIIRELQVKQPPAVVSPKPQQAKPATQPAK